MGTDQEKTASDLPPADKPVVRWSVVIWGAAAVALGIGYVSGRMTTVPSVVDTSNRDETFQASVSEKENAGVESAKAPLPDPERPRPQSADELVKEVRESVDYLIKLFPESPDALEMKARIEKWLGQTSEAVKIWEQCLALNPKYVHAYVGMAQTAAEKGEHERAAELARQAIEIDRANFQARYTLADSLIHLRRPAEAIPVLKETIGSDPRSLGYFELGQAHFDLKQFDEARKNLEAALQMYPDYAEALYLLSRTHRELGDEASAKKRLEEYQKLALPAADGRVTVGKTTDLERMTVGAAVIYSDAGRMLMLNGRELDAEMFWRRAAKLDPKNIPCRQSLAFLDRKQNRIGETICWFKDLAELEPSNIGYWMEMGGLYEELNALPAAEKAFRKVIEIAPEKADGYSGLADLFMRHNRKPEESESLAKQAVERSPLPQHYALLSAAYQANGKHQAALTAIEKALELAPQSPSYRAVRDSIKKEINKN